MTDREIIIEVAKLDGHTTVQDEEDEHLLSVLRDGDYVQTISKDSYENWVSKLPPYLTSRDAIVPVIERLITNDELEIKFNYAVYASLLETRRHAMTFIMAVTATARQLCVALLVATSKWKD